MLSILEAELAEAKAKARNDRQWYKTHKKEITRVAEAFEGIELQRVKLESECIDLSVSGGYDALKDCFRVFRTLGYEPENRPEEEKFSSFSTYFNHPEQQIQFWLSYTSTLCKMVRVGTKTVEQPIYEVVCE